MYLVGLAASLVLFAIVYFAVIRPDQNTANQALKTGLQQSQQVINQAQKALTNSGESSAVTGQAQQALGNAAKLTACVASAGTDAGALQTCQVKYGH
jgi:preprotein translocase subunit YajC